MHHLKETTIDGVKFVLIPEELHDTAAKLVAQFTSAVSLAAKKVADMWEQYDPEVFSGF